MDVDHGSYFQSRSNLHGSFDSSMNAEATLERTYTSFNILLQPPQVPVEIEEEQCLNPEDIKSIGGVVDIYSLLWTKDSKGHGCSGVMIPDTVQYNNIQCETWYFMSQSDGKIRRKHTSSLQEDKIVESFLTMDYELQNHQNMNKRRNPHEIVGYVMKPTAEGKDTSTIEYLDDTGLKNYVYADRHTKSLLQKFVESKGPNNAVIRAVWSPQVCILEKKVNRHKLNDKKHDMSTRAVTYDGADQYSTPEPIVSDMLAGRIRQMCQGIVEHIERLCLNRHKVRYAELYLKNDDYDQLWLLWCTSLRFTGQPFTEQPLFPVQVCDHLGRIGPTGTQPPRHERQFKCPGCNQLYDSNVKYEVAYKTVISQYQEAQIRILDHRAGGDTTHPHFLQSQKQISEMTATELSQILQVSGPMSVITRKLSEADKADDPKDDSSSPIFSIPPIIKRVAPNILLSKYKKLLRDPSFLHTTIDVCETCCLAMSDSALLSVRESLPSLQKSRGFLPSIAQRGALLNSFPSISSGGIHDPSKAKKMLGPPSMLSRKQKTSQRTPSVGAEQSEPIRPSGALPKIQQNRSQSCPPLNAGNSQSSSPEPMSNSKLGGKVGTQYFPANELL
eukprot:TRINITY_DN5356_c0_g1_i5.p1 TRINITY_DN5356_c0_g1~~TRINITY_DN5356_c0_g1_i5.p1  ORF type:complete len:614 (+),score=120.48 TRINITY_DN5356_c0_g1_i5:49-1890(+)